MFNCCREKRMKREFDDDTEKWVEIIKVLFCIGFLLCSTWCTVVSHT
jgi:hypothetical protein